MSSTPLPSSSPQLLPLPQLPPASASLTLGRSVTVVTELLPNGSDCPIIHVHVHTAAEGNEWSGNDCACDPSSPPPAPHQVPEFGSFGSSW